MHEVCWIDGELGVCVGRQLVVSLAPRCTSIAIDGHNRTSQTGVVVSVQNN